LVEGETNPEQKYPVGTLIYYGPDAETVTKITAGIVFGKDSTPLKRQWYGDNVTTNPVVLAELGRFFKDHGVTKVVMTDKVAGCPHEPGVDYPLDQECPFCPFWKKSPTENENESGDEA
jgi:hypothetical protein